MVECKLCNNVVEGPAYVSKCEKILHIKCATQIIGDGGSCKSEECPYKYYVQLKDQCKCPNECLDGCPRDCSIECCQQGQECSKDECC